MALSITAGLGAFLNTILFSGEHTPVHLRAAIDTAGRPFIPALGTISTAFTRTGGLITSEVQTSVVGGVTRTKTITYTRVSGVITATSEGPWVQS